MAVYTHISDDAFRTLLAGYGIGTFREAKPISEGVSNTNYLLITDQDRYIFTVYEKMVNPSDIPYFLALMEYLATQGIPCPLPIHDKGKSVIRLVDGKPAAITSFLEGKAVKSPQNEHCSELGRLMARMHLASLGFTGHRANDYAPALVWDKYAAVVRQAGMEKELSEHFTAIAAQWPKKLPSGVIHGDPFPDNVFFTAEKATGLIDFYFACNDFLAYDIAIALNCWCFEHHVEFNITKARHLLQGYNEVRKLSGSELEALPVLAAGAALRFLLTRLDNWVNRQEDALVTPHNPEDYLHRLRFHMQVRNHKEYGL